MAVEYNVQFAVGPGTWVPEYIYNAAEGSLYYTTGGQARHDDDPLLGLPRFDMHYARYDISDMVEIMPGIYGGPAAADGASVFPGRFVIREPAEFVGAYEWRYTDPVTGHTTVGPRKYVERGVPQPFQAAPAWDYGVGAAPVPFCPAHCVPLPRTPNVPIPSAGAARAGSRFTQVPGRAPPSVDARACARAYVPGPARTASQYAQQPIPSSQGRTPSHQPSGRAVSFLDPVNASNHRTPSFQGRNGSHLGPVPYTNVRTQQPSSFQGRPSFSARSNRQPPARAASQFGADSLRVPSVQSRANSFRPGVPSVRVEAPSVDGIVPIYDPVGWRPHINAPHNHYRRWMKNESGRHFDQLDDSVIAAYVNARGFMWEVEIIERLTIGPETDLDGDRDGAVAWSIPISYLGLYYTVLEVFFPLSEASVHDLPNDILRVLHVALGLNEHDGQLALVPVSDGHLAESRRQVLLELERRGFEAFLGRGFSHQHMQGLLYDQTGAFKPDEPIASISKQQPATPSSSKVPKRPNASVLQPDRQRQTATPSSSSTKRPAAVTVPSQQTGKFFGTAMENAQVRIDTCRREIQDKPSAFFRGGRGPSCKKFNEKPYEHSESQLLFPYSIPIDAYAKAKGKGKARATSDHEEDW